MLIRQHFQNNYSIKSLKFSINNKIKNTFLTFLLKNWIQLNYETSLVVVFVSIMKKTEFDYLHCFR